MPSGLRRWVAGVECVAYERGEVVERLWYPRIENIHVLRISTYWEGNSSQIIFTWGVSLKLCCLLMALRLVQRICPNYPSYPSDQLACYCTWCLNWKRPPFRCGCFIIDYCFLFAGMYSGCSAIMKPVIGHLGTVEVVSHGNCHSVPLEWALSCNMTTCISGPLCAVLVVPIMK